jgi:branched-chain amino acid aminotransferase
MIPLRVSGEELDALVIETARRSGLRDAYVQMIATGGVRSSPSARSTGEPTLIVFAIPYVWIHSREKIAGGISVITPSIRQWPASVVDAKVKSLWTEVRPAA